MDLVVLAGGAARRLGGVAKGEVHVAGRAMLDHVLDAAGQAQRVVVVGPDELARPGTTTLMEHPPGGGPVAGIEAALRHLESEAPSPDGLVAVLACDVPRSPRALAGLRRALGVRPEADGAHLTDHEGRSQLVMLLRAAPLRSAIDRLGAERGTWGCSVRRLVAELDLVDVADEHGYGRDADTWDDVEVLDALLEEDRGHG